MMAGMTDTPVDEHTDEPEEPDSAPLFGAIRADRTDYRIRYEGPDGEGEERITTRLGVDAGAMLAYVRSSGDNRINTAADLMLSSAVDDDGIPARYLVPRVGKDDPRVKAGKLTAGQPDTEHPDFREDWADRAAYSSRRRLAALLDDPRRYVDRSIYEEITQWLISRGTGRPTTGPARSSRGPGKTGRGSKGKRS